MYRKGEYDKMVSKHLQHPKSGQNYLLAFVEDDEFTIEEALRSLINRMGTTEFSKLVGEKKSNVTNFLNGKRTLKEETLNKYLNPFKLKIVKQVRKVA